MVGSTVTSPRLRLSSHAVFHSLRPRLFVAIFGREGLSVSEFLDVLAEGLGLVSIQPQAPKQFRESRAIGTSVATRHYGVRRALARGFTTLRRNQKVKKTTSKVAYVGVLGVVTSIGLGAIIPAPLAQNAAGGKTLANLQAAYDGENNAHARYLAFAQKADAEGYAQVASLFRAAARAEQIHLTNHAAVIRQMGAEPHAIIEMPLVRSTKENLEASANKGEAYERDTMYPGFIKQAQAEDNGAAVQTFELARNAEAQHFRLFIEALDNLENMKTPGHTYYVCTVCGYTIADPPSGDCVSCASPREKYEAVK